MDMFDTVHTWVAAVGWASASALDRESRTSAAFAVVAARIAPKRRARCGGRKCSTSHRDSARKLCAFPALLLMVTWPPTLMTFDSFLPVPVSLSDYDMALLFSRLTTGEAIVLLHNIIIIESVCWG